VSISVDPTHAHEVAILKSANIAAYNQAVSGFKSSMPSNTRFIEYDLKGDTSSGRKYASKIRASGVDLVLAVGLKAAIAARLEIFDVPVVFCMVLHPSKYDLKADSMVGISVKTPIGQQLSILHAMMPNLKRIGYLYDPEKTPRLSAEASNQARQLGITLIDRQVKTEEQVPTALRELLAEIDALWLISDSTVLTEESFSFLLGASFDRRVPVIGFDPEFVRRGALLSFWVDSADVGQEAGQVAQAILEGLSVPSPRVVLPKQRISVNLGTAGYLGIKVPANVLDMVDEVY
jgi:putative ABC transport system substrate-binding protein